MALIFWIILAVELVDAVADKNDLKQIYARAKLAILSRHRNIIPTP